LADKEVDADVRDAGEKILALLRILEQPGLDPPPSIMYENRVLGAPQKLMSGTSLWSPWLLFLHVTWCRESQYSRVLSWFITDVV